MLLNKYKAHRQAMRGLKELAMRHYLDAIEKFTFITFRKAVVKEMQLKHASHFMRQSRLNRHGKRAILKLRANKESCRQY